MNTLQGIPFETPKSRRERQTSMEGQPYMKGGTEEKRS